MTRLGIYVDDVYRVVGSSTGQAEISTDRAFLLFACEVGAHFDDTILLGRSIDAESHADYVLPPGVRLVPLPHYHSLGELGSLVRKTIGTARAMWRGVDRIDIVWVFGPHPYGLLLVMMALLRRRKVVLGIRQDTMEYFKRRANRRSGLKLAGAGALDRAFVVLGRFLPTTAVGGDLARRYGSRRRAALPIVVSLVPAAAVVEPRGERRARMRTVRLLTVGRLDREKNPLLLIEALSLLDAAEPGRFHLHWIGRGDLEDEVRSLAAERGVGASLSLVGYVPFGSELLDVYRKADIFVHVSLTEGVPQVLIEALASGVPVVATAVGGVPWLVKAGEDAVLVPPGDAGALVDAIRRVADDPALAHALSSRGIDVAKAHTLETHSERVARYLHAAS